MLAEVFKSLAANTARKDQVSVWIYADEDDQVTRDALARKVIPDIDLPVQWYFGAQLPSLGDTFYVLWQRSGRTSEAYMVTCDDVRFDTPGWDDIVRQKAAECADGIFLAGPYDPATADTCTYPIFGWKWLELQRMFPSYFPYWFDDRWVHQVGMMSGRYAPLPITMFPIRGKGRTRRMRDLPFWTRFFQLTLVERKETAKKLIDLVHAGQETARTAALKTLEERAAELSRQYDGFSDAYCVFQEERFTQHTIEERRAFDSVYLEREARAVAKLIGFAQARHNAGQHQEAIEFLDATFLSNVRVKQAQELKVACLRALGRTAEAERLAQETVAAWPEMNGLRRLFRFLGMVASDGKTMINGFLRKGKASERPPSAR